jgi:2-methylaconitate cis-trans-isomerase PrpF
LFLVYFVPLSDRNGVFSSEVTAELERLRVAADAFLDFLGVAPGAREECLYNARRHVLDAIESDVCHGTRVALAMAEVSVEADLTGVNGFPMREDLHRHEDLVARYGLAREAVAAHVPAAEVLARLPPH